MAELQAGRLINVRFERDAVLPPAMAGLHVRECHAERIAIEYVGPLPPVLEWLSGQAVRGIACRTAGVERYLLPLPRESRRSDPRVVNQIAPRFTVEPPGRDVAPGRVSVPLGARHRPPIGHHHTLLRRHGSSRRSSPAST
jgi:hypothetical protein